PWRIRHRWTGSSHSRASDVGDDADRASVIARHHRHGRWGQWDSAGAGGEGQRRDRLLLANTWQVPVAHTVGEGGLQARPLRGRENDWRIVDRVERLQLALQDVLGQWPTCHL